MMVFAFLLIGDTLFQDRILEIASTQGYEKAISHLKDPYQFGMDLIVKDNRPQAAVSWFAGISRVETISDQERESYIFGHGWALWHLQKIREALKIAIELEVIAKDNHVKVRNQFLLANIYFRTGQNEQAALFFNKALKAYSTLGIDKGVFQCLIGLANVAISTGHDSALSYIKQAKEVNEKLAISNPSIKFDDSYFLGLYRDIAFSKGNYRTALDWAEKEEQFLRQKTGRSTVWVLSLCRTGIVHAFCGNYQKAIEIAKVVDREADAIGVPFCKKLNLFIWYAVGRCRGLETTVYEREMEEYAKEADDRNYQLLKDKIEEITCK